MLLNFRMGWWLDAIRWQSRLDVWISFWLLLSVFPDERGGVFNGGYFVGAGLEKTGNCRNNDEVQGSLHCGLRPPVEMTSVWRFDLEILMANFLMVYRVIERAFSPRRWGHGYPGLRPGLV